MLPLCARTHEYYSRLFLRSEINSFCLFHSLSFSLFLSLSLSLFSSLSILCSLTLPLFPYSSFSPSLYIFLSLCLYVSPYLSTHLPFSLSLALPLPSRPPSLSLSLSLFLFHSLFVCALTSSHDINHGSPFRVVSRTLNGLNNTNLMVRLFV